MKQATTRTKTRGIFAFGGVGILIAVALTPAVATASPSPVPRPSNSVCPSADGVTPTTVDWAMFYPKTGPAAPTFAGAESAARLRIAQENAKGGVNGRKIVLTAYDDQSAPTTQSQMATKAIEQDDNFGILLTSSTEAMFPYLKSKNVPVVGFNAVANGADRNAFSAIGIASPIYANTADYVRLGKAGVSKLAVVTQASSSSIAAGNNMVKVQSVVGIPVTLQISDEPTGAHDATSTALRVKNSGVDGLWESVIVEGGISIAQALKQQGVNLKGVIIPGIVDPSVVQHSNGALDGVIGSTYGNIPLTVAGVPAVRTFVNGMKAVGLNPYAAIAPIGYIEADLMIKGLKLAGQCPTRDSFVNALRTVKNYNGAGMLPQAISFTPGVLANGTPPKCKWYQVVINGELVPDKAATCGKLIDTNSLQVVG